MQRLTIKSPVAKITWGILAALAGLIFLLLLGRIEETRMQAQTDNWAGRSIENGAVLFSNNCITCHGPEGKGVPGVAPALNSHYFFTDTGRIKDVGWAGSMEDYIKLTIAAGRPSKHTGQWAATMPTWGAAFGGPLRADQVEDVVAYVMNWRESAFQQTVDEDPFMPFLDVSKPPELQNIEALTMSDEELAAAIEELKQKKREESADQTPEGPRPPQELWTSMGCSGCHNIDANQADARGPIAPNMNDLYQRAGDQVEGQSAEEYVHNSIVDPNAFVADSYPSGIMPQNFAERMSDEEIQGLVEWLLNPNREP